MELESWRVELNRVDFDLIFVCCFQKSSEI